MPTNAPIVYLTPLLKARPEHADEFARGIAAMAEPSRREPGCLEYSVFRSKLDPTLFVLWERWESQAALDAHCRTPHYQLFVETCVPLLESDALHLLTPLA